MLSEKMERILIHKAIEARSNSYSPYSKFPVGAALLTEDGEIFTGVNVENASIGLTICAERSAMTAAVSNGKRKFLAIAVSGPNSEPTPPCGACRQFMAEFGDFPVFIVGTEKTIRTSVAELLPLNFKL